MNPVLKVLWCKRCHGLREHVVLERWEEIEYAAVPSHRWTGNCTCGYRDRSGWVIADKEWAMSKRGQE